MATFSNVGPHKDASGGGGEIKVSIPPVKVDIPPIDWQPILDAMASSQERSEFKADLLVAAVDELAVNLKIPAPQVTVTPQVAFPDVKIDVNPPAVEVKPVIRVPPAEITLKWSRGLVWAAILNGLALLLLASAVSFQIYSSLK